MISENEVRKHYGDNTGKIIRKGDAGWKSDHPERMGEAYGMNPLSTMEHKMAQRRVRSVSPEVDPNTLEAGVRTVTDDGRDAYHWVVVEVRDKKRRAYGYDADAMVKVWRLRYTQRNAAL